MVLPTSPTKGRLQQFLPQRWKLSRSSFLLGCGGGALLTICGFVWSVHITLSNRQLDDDASLRAVAAHLETTTTAVKATSTHDATTTTTSAAAGGKKLLRQQPQSDTKEMTTTTTKSQSLDGKLLADVTEYVKKNGAYINDKIEIKTINGILTGIFAKEPLEKGEVAWHIPEKLWEHPSSGRYCEAVDMVRRMSSSSSSNRNNNPYKAYLASRTASQHHNLPFLWSTHGQSLLKELFGRSLPFSSNYKGVVEDWWKNCDYQRTFSSWQEVDQSVVNAIATVEARHEDRKFALMPFQDVANHVRGDAYNVEPSYVDHRRGSKYGVGFQVKAIRPIAAGEQLGFSYVDCKHCGNNQHDPFKYPTHYLFMEYGFVESFPQYWKLHGNDEKIKFKLDVDPNDTTSVRVSFYRKPSSSEIRYLSKELERLGEFERRYRPNNTETTTTTTTTAINNPPAGKKKSAVADASSLPRNEYELIWQYHKAFTKALQLAIAQASPQ